jgi:predicted XRE-type DNA-binding protein
MTSITQGSTNVYADLESPDSEQMLLKAQLAEKISQIIQRRHLTQTEAASILGIPQSKLSLILRGQFRGVSELKMLECLNRLGRDVQIVVKKAPRTKSQGRISVVFA